MADYANITALDPEAVELLDNQVEVQDEDTDEPTEDIDTAEDDGDIEGEEEVTEDADEQTEEHTDETLPSKLNIDGIGEVSLDEIKEWKNGYLRQSDYTRKTQELAKQRDETKDAMEVYNFLKNNPQLVEGLKSQDPQSSQIVNKATVENDTLREVLKNQKSLEIDMKLNSLHNQYGEFSDVEVLNKAAELRTDDLETVLKAVKYSQQQTPDINAILAQAKSEWLKELEKNKSAVATTVSQKGKPTNDSSVKLTDAEKRIADNMGMSYKEYAKWK